MVFGTGPEAGSEIVLHPKVRAVSFTGPSAVGHYIQEKSAHMVKKLSLEVAIFIKNLNFSIQDILQ